MSFWHKNNEAPLNSAEYESLAKKFVEVSSRLEELENKIKILTTNYDNLRGNFNRKLAGLKKEEPLEEEEEEIDEPQNINNPVILPENGIIKKHRK